MASLFKARERVVSILMAATIAVSMFQGTAFAFDGDYAVKQIDNKKAELTEDYTQYVNTFVGTDVDGGQLFPGAVTPSGLVKLSPDTYPHDNNDHAGYDYSKNQISGFSHTRVEGVGGDGAGGDFLVTPSYIITTTKPADSVKAQNFSHSDEEASPGYYKVLLTPKKGTGTTDASLGKITAELTTNNNVGLHQYTFPKSGEATLTVDLGYGYNNRNGKNSTMQIKTENGKTTMSGMLKARTVGNKTDYTLYYYAETEIAASSVLTWGSATGKLDETSSRSGADIGAVLHFNVNDGSKIRMKVALSTISAAQAKRDMEAQMPGWSFDEYKQAASKAWNDILSRVKIETDTRAANDMKTDELYNSFYKEKGNTPDTNVYSPGGSMAQQAELTEAQEDARLKTLFYTHLYHMFTTPVNATSTDNTFRVNANTVKEADDFTYYDSWSLWDDFRKYPVLGLIAPDIYKNQIKSIAYLAQYGKNNLYGDSLSTNTVPTVRSEHAVALLADGVAKGFTDIDNLEAAYEKFKTISTKNWGGETNADTLGYVPGRVDSTVEYSYDDWCISFLARVLNKAADITKYYKRSTNYRNLFRSNAVTKSYTRNGVTITDKIDMLWPKDSSGNWKSADPEGYGDNGMYQGTLWQYSLWDSYDVSGLMKLMGDGDLEAGKEDFLTYLKYLYGMNTNDNATAQELQNAMLHSNTNEIDLQTPYMFNVAGKPSLTQYWTRQIYTKATWNSYSGTGRGNTIETNNKKPVYAYKLDPYGFMETMDDDCGTMAGNFVAAAMGLYPMTPGDTTFQITSPFFKSIAIDLGNGKTFTIKANGVSSENYYIQSATLNGKAFNRSWIDYSEIMRGGVLEFEMGSTPSTWEENGISVPSVDDLNGKTVAQYLQSPALEYSTSKVTEDTASDGGVSQTITITAKNGVTFSGTNNEDFVASGKASVHNLPEGLTASITKTSDTTAVLSFKGKAVKNDTDVDNVAVSFNDNAFAGGFTANDVTDSYKANLNAIVIDFTQDLKAKLQAYVDKVKDTQKAGYTSASYTEFTNKLSAANAVLANASATDEDYQVAYENLSYAYNSLVAKANAFDPLMGTAADVYENCQAYSKYAAPFAGSAVGYKGLDFGNNGVAKIKITYSKSSSASPADAAVEIRTGSSSGTLIKSARLPSTGTTFDTSSGTTYTIYLSNPKLLAGNQDVYFKFTASDNSKKICNLFEVNFVEGSSYGKVEAENYISCTPEQNPYKDNDRVIKVENTTDSGTSLQNIGGSFDGAWLAYDNMNFTGAGVTKVSVRYSNNPSRCASDARAEFHLDSVDGPIFATVNLPSTGGWTPYKTASADATSNATGNHVVYVVLRGTNNTSLPHIANIDYFVFETTVDKTALNSKISEVEATKPDAYSTESFAAFTQALNTAREVAADTSAIQEAVDAAADDLAKAFAALEPFPKTTSIVLDPASVELKVGDTYKISPKAYVGSKLSTDARNNSFIYLSSDTSVATVLADGTVKALKVGDVTVLVRSADSPTVSASFTVKVKSAVVAVNSVKITKKKLTLTVGGTGKLSVSVSPSNATNKTVSFKSSNKKVATVSSSGKVTAKSVGTATITASAGGKKATCTITVVPKKPSKITVKKSGKKIVIKYKKDKSFTGVQIVITGKKKLKVSTTKTPYTTKSLPKGVYSVKIRSYKKVSGKTYYSSYTKAYKITIK